MTESEFDDSALADADGWTVREMAPGIERVTLYDQSHFLTYARLIDSERAGTDWREAASAILLCNVEQDPEGTLRCWQSHLARAHWVIEAPA